MSFNSFLLGNKGGMKQASTMTPQQQSAMQNILSMGQQNMQQGMANANPDALENRARTMFNTQTVPGLAERFTSMGGGQRSSAFQSALGLAGSDLESQLEALRSQFGMQQQQLGSQQAGLGLHPMFENYYEQGKPGFLQSLLGTAMQSLGQAGPMALQQHMIGQQQQQQQNNAASQLQQLLPLLMML